MRPILSILTVLGLSTCLILGTGSCKKPSESNDSVTVVPQVKKDTTALLVMEVSRCAKLYTSEYQIHKIVTHSDDPRFKGSFLGIPIDMKARVGSRKIAIPIDVTLKAYIDFSNFNESNIERDDSSIVVTLPDPHIVATASKVDHKGTRQFVDMTRSDFTDEEITNFSKQGADTILQHISQYGIVEQAQLSAMHHLQPILRRMGYEDRNITIRFKKKFSDKDLIKMIVKQ